MKIDTDAFASAFQMNMTEDDMKELFASLSSSGSSTYEGNLQKLGYADFDEPSSISIYPKNFESKEHVVSILDGYNDTMEKERQKRAGNLVHRYGRHSDVLRHGYRQHHQLRADRLLSAFPLWFPRL